jgi:hypothetical protein
MSRPAPVTVVESSIALNAARHGLSDQIELHRGDMFDSLG